MSQKICITHEYLAELMDHPIKHVIHEINEFVFPILEETNKPHT